MLHSIKWQTVQKHNTILFVAGNLLDCYADAARYAPAMASGTPTLRRAISQHSPYTMSRFGSGRVDELIEARGEDKPSVKLMTSRSQVPAKRRGRGRG